MSLAKEVRVCILLTGCSFNTRLADSKLSSTDGRHHSWPPQRRAVAVCFQAHPQTWAGSFERSLSFSEITLMDPYFTYSLGVPLCFTWSWERPKLSLLGVLLSASVCDQRFKLEVYGFWPKTFQHSKCITSCQFLHNDNLCLDTKSILLSTLYSVGVSYTLTSLKFTTHQFLWQWRPPCWKKKPWHVQMYLTYFHTAGKLQNNS